MTVEYFNNRQAADKTDIHESTIRSYVRKFDIPCFKNDLGHTQYGEEMIPVFLQIKSMKEEGLTDDVVQATIKPALEKERLRLEESPEAVSSVDMGAVEEAIVERLQKKFGNDQQKIINNFIDAFRDEYGTAMQKVGEYEAHAKFLAKRLHEYENNQVLLPAQAESLRDAQESQRTAEAERERANQTAKQLTEENRMLSEKVTQLERANARLEAEQETARAQAEKAEAKAEEARTRHQQVTGNLAASQDRVRYLEKDLEEAKRDIEALKNELADERNRGIFGIKRSKK